MCITADSRMMGWWSRQSGEKLAVFFVCLFIFFFCTNLQFFKHPCVAGVVLRAREAVMNRKHLVADLMELSVINCYRRGGWWWWCSQLLSHVRLLRPHGLQPARLLGPRVAPVVKDWPANAGHTRDTGSIPGSGRSSRGRNGHLLQYSCLKS